MAVRPSWSGNLKLSLITIPVRLYRAVSSTAKTSLNMLHEGCNQRIRYQYTCPVHGEVEKGNIVKGYQYEKGKFVVLEEETLDKVKVETSKILEIVQFVGNQELDPVYLETPYYLSPDGPVAEEAFRVLREAMRESGKTAIGRVTMAGREHLVAIAPEDKGLLLTTLHYNPEVRSAAPYFAEIKDAAVNPEELQLARQLIETRSRPFRPEEFTDRYEEALQQTIRSRIEGREPEVVEVPEVGRVVDFMEALKRSVAQEARQADERQPSRQAPAGVRRDPPRSRQKKSG
ncbi:MAG: Ku protein [Desulfuromonadales bacterium]|nr:Ku protein [Desulfuromonadales bacterium]